MDRPKEWKGLVNAPGTVNGKVQWLRISATRKVRTMCMPQFGSCCGIYGFCGPDYCASRNCHSAATSPE